MPIYILNITKSNGEVEIIGHLVPSESLSLYLDVVTNYTAIFDHVRASDELPDEEFTLNDYLQKEKEFLDLLHNIGEKVNGCSEIMLLETMTLNLSIT